MLWGKTLLLRSKKQLLYFFGTDRFREKFFGAGDPQLPAVGRLPEARVTGLYGCSYELVIFVVSDVDILSLNTC